MPRSAVMELLGLKAHQFDRLLAQVRWLLLGVGGVVGLILPGSPLPALIVLGLGGLYNAALLGMLSSGFWPPLMPMLTLSLDTLLALAIIEIGGGAGGPLVWAGLFPVIAGAARLGQGAGLGVMAVITLAEAILIMAFEPVPLEMLPPLLLQGVFLLAAAVIAGGAGERARRILAELHNRERQLEQESMRLHTGRDQVRAIYQMASAISANLDHEKVLNAALDLVGLGLTQMDNPDGQSPDGASLLVSAVLLVGEDGFYVAAGRRLTPSDMRVRLPGQSGLLAKILKSGESELAPEPFRDPELQTFVAFRPCAALMCVPLAAGFEVFGVLLFGHPEVDYLSPERAELLEAIGNQASVAIQNARLFRNLEKEKERLVEVEEEARKKLARDLHDGPTQSVAAIAMRASYARRLIGRDPQTASSELFKLEDLARRTTREIRHMLFTLRPLILESQGLEAALRQLAEKVYETHGQEVTVEAEPGATEDLELGKQGVVFYIAEEAINNARKHAVAKMIWVRLQREGDLFLLEVEDNGVGFNVGSVDASYVQRGSLGMVNMRERAELVNGLLQLESAEGKGTRIRLLVPLTEQAQDRLRR